MQTRVLQNDDHTRVVQFQFEAERGLAEHQAPFPITMYLARGEASIRTGEESHDASEGFWAYVPAGMPHAVTAKTGATLLVTMFKGAAPKP